MADGSPHPTIASARPPVCFVNRPRAAEVMRRFELDAVIGATHKNLYYLSGFAPDSVIMGLQDVSAAAVLPLHEGAPPCLIASDYDLAYLVTHPTWLPALRMFSARSRSSAAVLIEQIGRGEGLDTEIRRPLRELYQRTRDGFEPDLIAAIARYIETELPKGRLRIGFDDLRVAAEVRARIGTRLEAVDALHIFRAIRLVKTPAEIEILRAGARINDAAVLEAIAASRVGEPIYRMVEAYRLGLVKRGAKFMGERGMLFAAGPDGGFVLDNDYAEQRRFSEGDIGVYDAIGSYKLYNIDMARIATVGPPSERLVRLHDAIGTVIAEGEERLRPGANTRAVMDHCTRVLGRLGLRADLTTLVFHSIGLDILEYGDPREKYGGWTVEADMTMNFEVFHRDPDLGGVHMEDTVLVTRSGLEHFSTLPRKILRCGAG